MMKRCVPLAAASSLVLAVASVLAVSSVVAAQTTRPRRTSDAAAQDEAARVGVRRTTPHGAHLVDANGHALYTFTADRQGHSSACGADCVLAWSPLLTRGAPVARSETVRERLLGMLQRREGTMQVTYDGWPLYRFARDEGPGDVRGQGIEAFGGVWHLVSPDGGRIAEAIPSDE